ncbi:hypothetical protein NL676_015328 [Syzygium grande]|nr:hypothetical protein NL676_015328 [Syzygium grande]
MSRDHGGPRGPRRTVPRLPLSRGPSSPPRAAAAIPTSPMPSILSARAAGAYSFLHGRKSNPTPVDSIFLIAIEHRIQIRH